MTLQVVFDVAVERFKDDRLVSEEMRLQDGNVDV